MQQLKPQKSMLNYPWTTYWLIGLGCKLGYVIVHVHVHVQYDYFKISTKCWYTKRVRLCE